MAEAGRLSLDETWRTLEARGERMPRDPAGRPFVPARMPDYEDEELGFSFFGDGRDGEDFGNLTLPRTFFGHSTFRRTRFAGSDLSESRLCWNDFLDCDFTGADLSGADLRAATFERCTFAGANLRGADLRRSSFADCDFTGADLAGRWRRTRTRTGACRTG